MSHGRRRSRGERWRIELIATDSSVVKTHRRRSLHRRRDHLNAFNGFNFIDLVDEERVPLDSGDLDFFFSPRPMSWSQFLVTIEFETARDLFYFVISLFFFCFKMHLWPNCTFWLLTWVSFKSFSQHFCQLTFFIIIMKGKSYKI